MAVGGAEAVGVLPVHLELAVRILVVVLIRVPAEIDHVVADLADDVVAAHERRLVIAGLLLDVPPIGDCGAVLVDEEELALDPGAKLVAQLRRRLDLTLEDDAGRRLDIPVVHPEIGRQPCDLGPPGESDETVRVRHGEHVGVRGSHVEPRREAGEARPVTLHVPDRPRRHELGAKGSEEVREADEEIPDPFLFRELGEVRRHG